MTSAALTSARRVPEILAPAGGMAQFFAALHAGADAVYLGLKEFNARARADNFTIADLSSLVPLAHRHGMKVLVTLNIVIKEDELESLIERLVQLAAVNVDGIIVQDLGLVRLVKHYVPELRLHGSTQMAVHNAAGVRQLHAWGFKRVVLARELSATELRNIRQVCDRAAIEIETFCHGSLCYSYSGLCFFSGTNDARSGNRGECAYTCRKPYKILNEPGQGFLFSMRDLHTAEHLQLFVDAGVDVLKIEGRKKDAQYVASSVQLYRQRLNELFGKPTGRQPIAPTATEDLERDLKFGFQRQPTSLFLRNRYHENVIDLNSPTHEGLLVGNVVAINSGRAPGTRKLTVHLSGDLEVHDGVRISAPATRYHAAPQHGSTIGAGHGEALTRIFENDSLQFSVENIWPSGAAARVFTAQAGATVDLEIAASAATKAVAVGDSLYKVRSADLKRRTEAIAKSAERVRRELAVSLHLTVVTTGAKSALQVQAMLGRMTLPLFNLTVPDDLTTKGDCVTTVAPPSLGTLGPRPDEQDDRFIIIHDIAGQAEALHYLTSLSSKHLKLFKKQLRTTLLACIDAYMVHRIQAAQQANRMAVQHTLAKVHGQPRIAVKFDQLSYLDYLRTYGFANLQQRGVSELVLEPKRHLLGFADIDTAMSSWLAAAHECDATPRFSIPVVVRGWDEPYLKKWLRAVYDAGVRAFEIANVGGLKFLTDLDIEIATLDISSDFSCYALNHQSSLFLAEQGVRKICLSLEDDLRNLEAHLNAWSTATARPQMLVYKDTPLFIAEACSLTALHNGCPTAKVCGYRTLHIENDEGERFYVAHENCKSIVYGERPAGFSQYMRRFLDLGIQDFRLDFLTRPYTQEEVHRILADVFAQRAIPGSHSVNMSSRLL